MEKFKISHFENYFQMKFPEYHELTKDECHIIKEEIFKHFRFRNFADPVEMLNEILDESTFVAEPNADDDDFDLSKLLNELGICPLENIYVDWRYFDEIDQFKFMDLSKNFFDIWYAGPDDIFLFDSSFSWLLFVNHHGTICYLKN